MSTAVSDSLPAAPLGAELAPAVEALSLYRFFRAGDEEVLALRGVSLTLHPGELVAVVGPSGSGKSTLLACLAGLDEPDGGTVRVNGLRISHQPEHRRARLRARHIGVLYQERNLLAHLTIEQDIVLTQRIADRCSSVHPAVLLASLGIADRGAAYPDQLSGGELVRAGLADTPPGRPSALSGCSATITEAGRMTDRACTPRACSVTTLLASLLLGLALIAHHAVTGTALDRAVLGWMVHHRSPALTSWAIAVTEVGSPVGIGVLAIAVSAVLWWRRGSPWPAVVVLATVAAAAAISTAIKVMVGAHRPPQSLQLVLETDPSFPSGHVTATLAVFGALIAVTAGHIGRAARATLIAVTVVGTAAVASTRLYLGVHWVTDILGGLLLGATVAVIAHLAYRHVVRPPGIDGQPGACSVSGPIHTVGASPE